MSMKDDLEEDGYSDIGIAINAVYHSKSQKMAVEMDFGKRSIIITKEVAEAIAMDLMESVGFCEAYEANDQDAMQEYVDKAIANGNEVGNLREVGINIDVDAKTYDDAEDLISDMEQQSTPNKTIH